MVQVRVSGHVGRIFLNRPDQINAINDDVRRALPEAVLAFDADPDIRVITIQGAGERGFSAGADVKEQREAETPLQAHRRLSSAPWLERIAAARRPTVALIHGASMGGGLELAMACDIRIASQSARFALPEVRLGLLPGGGGTQRLAKIVGLGWRSGP